MVDFLQKGGYSCYGVELYGKGRGVRIGLLNECIFNRFKRVGFRRERESTSSTIYRNDKGLGGW